MRNAACVLDMQHLKAAEILAQNGAVKRRLDFYNAALYVIKLAVKYHLSRMKQSNAVTELVNLPKVM